MDFKTYQYKAWETAKYPNMHSNIVYPTLGLVGESGEFANKVKKIQRDDNDILSPAKREQLIDELIYICMYPILALVL